MKTILTLFVLMILASAIASANTGEPASISATYNVDTGVLSASGTYDNAPCNNRLVGFALFIDGANPKIPDSGSLDGVDTETMHLVDSQSCSESGDWEDEHSLGSAPENVCVVIYDVHLNRNDEPKEGELIPAGQDRNKDNSHQKNDDRNSYSEVDCVEPELVHEVPIPEFGTIAGGLAVAGAGLGYIMLRRRK
ncbi:MAG TPA: hypothetical protein VJB90_00235 [Candidatus Nanoarchaeia archaeon]|nr:hypothetical protein [Candidatus Nanoarchaeia archaeon]